MTTRQRRGSGRVARRRPSARKRGFRVKGWKAFLFSFACRRCTLFSLKNPLSRTRWQKKTLGLFVSSILPLPPFLSFFRVFLSFLSLSLSLSLARFYSARAVGVFFNGRLVEHTSLCPWKQKSRNAIFTARDRRVAPRSLLTTDYATRRAFVLAEHSDPENENGKVAGSKSWSRFGVGHRLASVFQLLFCDATMQRADDVAVFSRVSFPVNSSVEEQRVARYLRMLSSANTITPPLVSG